MFRKLIFVAANNRSGVASHRNCSCISWHRGSKESFLVRRRSVMGSTRSCPFERGSSGSWGHSTRQCPFVRGLSGSGHRGVIDPYLAGYASVLRAAFGISRKCYRRQRERGTAVGSSSTARVRASVGIGVGRLHRLEASTSCAGHAVNGGRRCCCGTTTRLIHGY